MYMITLLFRVVVAFLAFSGFIASNDASPPTPEQQLLSDINAEREYAGLPPYAWSTAAATAAQRRVDDMIARDYLSHKLPDGRTGYVVELESLGILYVTAGENVAFNNYADTVDTAIRAFMGSPTHRANILDTEFDHVGIGYGSKTEQSKLFVVIFLGGARQ